MQLGRRHECWYQHLHPSWCLSRIKNWIAAWVRKQVPSINETTGFDAWAKERSVRYSDLKKSICGLGLPAT
jgi:hypothetical protein